MRFELFGRLKKHTAPAPQANGTIMREAPIEQVKELAAGGVPEADIIKRLKDEGYSFREIDEALNKAVKTGVGGPPYGGEAPESESVPVEAHEPDMAEQLTPESPPDAPAAWTPPGAEATGVNAEELEEIVDAITEEKIIDMKSVVEKSETSVRDMIEKVKSFAGDMDAAKAHTDEMNAEAERKIGEMRAKLEELEPKILGLERAFKDIMPNLVDSVREVKETMHSLRSKESARIAEDISPRKKAYDFPDDEDEDDADYAASNPGPAIAQAKSATPPADSRSNAAPEARFIPKPLVKKQLQPSAHEKHKSVFE